MHRRNPLVTEPSPSTITSSVRWRRGGARRGPRRAGALSTRELILGGAYRTLVDVGYNQVSMRKIAVEAGVNQSLLHYYFGSKEQLMVEALEYVNDELLARQRKMYAEAGTFEAIWDQALEYFREDIRSGYVRAMWELWAQGLSNPRIRKRWVETAQRWRDLVTDLARKALRDYGITRGYDAAVLGAHHRRSLLRGGSQCSVFCRPRGACRGYSHDGQPVPVAGSGHEEEGHR
jgi:AcrR family transcriptional regulator